MTTGRTVSINIQIINNNYHCSAQGSVPDTRADKQSSTPERHSGRSFKKKKKKKRPLKGVHKATYDLTQ